jgi:hypothetical protein
MKQALINLLKVKSLMTLAVMGVFIVLALKGKLEAETIAFVISSIITYYFTKSDKKEE